jgi:DNA replication and repair protein RecF
MLERLSLENFRNYQQQEIELAPTTVITGPNGAGKTSVLEAISMLSLTTSWKTEKDSEVVRWGAPFAKVSGGDMDLVVQANPYMKRMRINGVSKRTYQVIGHFPSVLFQPDDMQLLHGAPSFRRHYFDRILSQTSTVYTRAVLQLNQVLRQRNRLLKHIQDSIASEDELSFWDQQLADLQEVIQKDRLEFVDYLQARVPQTFAGLLPQSGEVTLHYVKSPQQAHEHSFLQHLHKNRVKEVQAGQTLYGPHREDLQVRWGEHPVEQSMSRGQLRSLLVAFKIAELSFITEKNEVRPILLLDDIFSELDTERRHRLFGVLGDYQVVMTTTELGNVQEILKDEVKVIELE